jgi:hypothetical protein
MLWFLSQDLSAQPSNISAVFQLLPAVHVRRVPEECPPEAAQLLRDCVQLDPLRRPTAAEVVRRLAAMQRPPQEPAMQRPPQEPALAPAVDPTSYLGGAGCELERLSPGRPAVDAAVAVIQGGISALLRPQLGRTSACAA